jgi:hypothetical protein
MNECTTLNRTFMPPDFFEEAIEIFHGDYVVTIADGQVEAKIDSVTGQANLEIYERLQRDLNNRFLAAQLLTHRAYELSPPTVVRMLPNGRKEFSVNICAHVQASASAVDFQVTDKDGMVVTDSRRQRIERKRHFADLVASHPPTDKLLDSLLQSYHAAVNDPDDELVHLYQIRTALADNFGGKAAACAATGITEPQWNRLGGLCNDEPLRQGLHRGRTSRPLRDASEAELAEAHGIALGMIEGYLKPRK